MQNLSKRSWLNIPYQFAIRASIRQWEVQDSNLRNASVTDLQSVPFNHSGNLPDLSVAVATASKESPVGQYHVGLAPQITGQLAINCLQF